MKSMKQTTPKGKEKVARTNLLRASSELKGVPVKGYDFNEGVDYEKLLDSFASTGFQATAFSDAVDVIQTIRKENVPLFVGFTSNMVSSGVRESIRYLFEHNQIALGVCTAGAIEEDIIKCLGDFYIGDFRASGTDLRKQGINRIGNLFAPNNRYVAFEAWFQPLLDELYATSVKTGIPLSPSDIVWAMGKNINDPRSICYWAWKHQIRLFCPALTDGALGDNVYFSMFKHPKLVIDIAKDTQRLNDATIGLGKLGLLILGAGVVKHALLNAAMLRNGAEYAVYINTSQEFDGSDAGALPEEALSWGKLKPGKHVKVFGDATILFPLLMAQTFAKK
jgi:deoxyhypusine synthase